MNNRLSSDDAKKLFEDNLPKLEAQVCERIRGRAERGFEYCDISREDFNISKMAFRMLTKSLSKLGYQIVCWGDTSITISWGTEDE